MKNLPRKTWMISGALGAIALTGAVAAGGASADTRSPSPSASSLIESVPVPTDTTIVVEREASSAATSDLAASANTPNTPNSPVSPVSPASPVSANTANTPNTPNSPPRESREADVLELLTGPGAREPLSLAVATVQAELADHEVHSVQHRPGDGVTVGYRVWLRTASGDLIEDYVLLSSTAGRDVPDDAAHVVSMQGPSGRLLGWRHPHDPALPGLEVACDPVALEHVVPGSGPVTSIELLGYRPLRRAVVRAVRDGRTAYVKVLRPAAGRGGAPDVLHRLAVLAEAGLPVPAVLAAQSDGLVVLEEVVGTPLAQAIGQDDASGLELGQLGGRGQPQQRVLRQRIGRPRIGRRRTGATVVGLHWIGLPCCGLPAPTRGNAGSVGHAMLDSFRMARHDGWVSLASARCSSWRIRSRDRSSSSATSTTLRGSPPSMP